MDCKGGGKIVSSVREDESAGIDEAQGKMQRYRSKGGQWENKHWRFAGIGCSVFGGRPRNEDGMKIG